MIGGNAEVYMESGNQFGLGDLAACDGDEPRYAVKFCPEARSIPDGTKALVLNPGGDRLRKKTSLFATCSKSGVVEIRKPTVSRLFSELRNFSESRNRLSPCQIGGSRSGSRIGNADLSGHTLLRRDDPDCGKWRVRIA
jgi:hypothetical protein